MKINASNTMVVKLSMLTSFALVLMFFTGCSSPEQGLNQNDPDQQVLDQLKAAGSDLSKPHKIEFFLYFPSKEKADGAATEMKKGLDHRSEIGGRRQRLVVSCNERYGSQTCRFGAPPRSFHFRRQEV